MIVDPEDLRAVTLPERRSTIAAAVRRGLESYLRIGRHVTEEPRERAP